jgi:hypothetical protein
MIRAILVVGWLGMALLLWAALSGHAAMGHGPGRDEASQHHLIVALFPTAALLFADLCLLIYMPGTARVARRTARERGLGAEWEREQARLAWRGAAPALVAVIATATLFCTGYPTYSGLWPPWIHLALVIATALLQLAVLLVGGRALLAGEARLKALGHEVARRADDGEAPAILPAPP